MTKTNSPRNIISYKLGTRFTGREIKDWIQYHLDNETSHTKVANTMRDYLNRLEDDVMYYLYKENYKSSENYNEYLVKRDAK